MRNTTRVALVATTFLAIAASRTATEAPTDLIVHEWGTFTSIAGEEGRAVSWLPLTGPPDLPSFVERAWNVPPKARCIATVRMETPVLYFYTPHDLVVDVTVGFQQGFITEYFPRATIGPAHVTPMSIRRPGFRSTITWDGVRILPHAEPRFPTDTTPTHYYEARDTDAAPLLVGAEQERFLFYRGVGAFPLPLSARVAPGGEVEVANLGSDEIPALLLFENRGGRVGYELRPALTGRTTIGPPTLDDEPESVQTTLEQILVAQGLYPKEASAMVATWSDAWFEEGTRLFYIVPEAVVDRILPLAIEPAPARVARVFVGRLELITAARLTDLEDALRTNDRARLAKLGRFLQPFGNRLLAEEMPHGERARLRGLLRAASSSYALSTEQ
jgi:hypothetical protein